MTVFNTKEINNTPFESNIIPKGNRNRPAYSMNPRYIRESVLFEVEKEVNNELYY
uniref:hypothetical protein n=1 Tax=Bacillus thuringiensis TaxID=1428 RepID=UPI00202B7D47|nr:hypothetical protein [Bacillus thuringiensis]UQM91874.1 hypothetical protein SY271_000290 [Bacillus thuringiensis]